MPKVPTYDGEQVRKAPLQGGMLAPIDSSAPFGGAAASQGLAFGRAGEGAALAYENQQARIKYRDDSAKADAAYVALQREYAETAIGWKKDRVGAKADGLGEDADKWWADAEQRYRKDLTPEQQQLLAPAAMRLRAQAAVDLQAFQAQEKRKFSIDAGNAFISKQIEQAAANPAANARASRDEIRRKVVELGVIHGMGTDQIEVEIGKKLTEMHTEVVRSMISQNNPQEAKRYFDQAVNVGDINETAANNLRLQIKKASDEKTALDLAESVAGLPLEDALKTIGGEKDPDIRKAARQHFLVAKHDQDLVKREMEKAASDRVWQAIANKRRPSSTDLNAMDGKERIQVEQYYNALAKGEAKNGRVHAKDDNYDVLDMAEQAIRQGDITQPNQLERFAPFVRAETFRTLRNSLEKRGQVSRTEVERAFTDRLGKTRAKWSENERGQWLAFQDYIDSNVSETKRPEDIDKWADRWFMPGYGKNDSLFTNDPETFGEAKTKGRKDFVIKTPDADSSAVDGALAILSRAGVKVAPGKQGRDEFYTNHYLDASRWFAARGEQMTPGRAAAYSILMANKKPVTPRNLNAIMEQLTTTLKDNADAIPR